MAKHRDNAARIPTGIEFLDRALGGGHVQRGVHGLLGPIGAGKTTLGTMIAAEGTRREASAASRGAHGVWVFVLIGEHPRSVREKAISHLAKISRNERRASILHELSSVSHFRQYELDRAAELRGPGGNLPGEYERYCAVQPVLRDHFLLVGMDDQRFDGPRKPLLQICDCLDASLNSSPAVVGVVIDHVGAAVDRYVMENDLSPRSISGHFRDFVSGCRAEIAERLDCPVWTVFQLSGEANLRRATDFQHHRDAGGCRRLGEELDVAVVLGTMDRSSGCLMLSCTKTPGRIPRTEPTLVCFDHHFATIREATRHRLDLVRQEIISTDTSIGEIDIDEATWDDLMERVGGEGRH